MEERANEDLKEIFDQVNQEDTFARSIGMRLVELQAGFARTAIPVTEATLNIHQIAHGGVIFAVADHACEAAGNSLGDLAVALQNNINFLSAGKAGDLLEATARLIHRSKRIGLLDFEVRNQEGHLLASGQQLIYFKQASSKTP